MEWYLLRMKFSLGLKDPVQKSNIELIYVQGIFYKYLLLLFAVDQTNQSPKLKLECRKNVKNFMAKLIDYNLISYYTIIIDIIYLFLFSIQQEGMKVSTLKFKQIFQKTHQQLITKEEILTSRKKVRQSQLRPQKKKSHILANDYKIIRCYRQRVQSSNQPKTAQCKLQRNSPIITHICSKKDLKQTQTYKENSQFLTTVKQEIIGCLQLRTQSEVKQICAEIKTLYIFYHQFQDPTKQKQVKNCFSHFQQNLSKYLKHRISRILFYITYIKYLGFINDQPSKENQLNKLRICQYYSRHLFLYSMTLSICMKIQQIYANLKNYDQSRQYGRKCLRIAVFIKNPSAEFNIIEKFKIISYYGGVLNRYDEIKVSLQERKIIMRTFSIIDDIPKVIGNEDNLKLKTSQIPYDAEDMSNTCRIDQISQNLQNFKNNLALMNKQFTQNSKQILKTINKVSQVGEVKKYLKDGNYITLKPRSRRQLGQNQSQVLIKNNQHQSVLENKQWIFFKEYLSKYTSLFKDLISKCDLILS